MTTPADRFAPSYHAWKKLEAAQVSGDEKRLNALDFTPVPLCARCQKPCVNTLTKERKAMRCGSCQAIIYCSRACQTADWKSSPDENNRYAAHKLVCARSKEHMKRVEYFQSQLTQFPWSRIEYDGSCPHDILRARFGVLGTGPKFGYWSTRADKAEKGANVPELFLLPEDLPLSTTTTYAPGQVLLGKTWPKHEDAWVLKNHKHIPVLDFDEPKGDEPKDVNEDEGGAKPEQVNDAPRKPPPRMLKDGEVNDWKSWYEWRDIPLDSPAALLMDYPLSLYNVLTNVLNLVSPQRSAEKRQELKVHLIGVENELNFIPLFSELALLLPHVDLKLTFFGKPAYDLHHTAKLKYESSLASTSGPIWSYKAPLSTGGGSISIYLNKMSENWTRKSMYRPLSDSEKAKLKELKMAAEEDPEKKEELQRYQGEEEIDPEIGKLDLPQALVGLNAGLLTSQSWFEPMAISLILDLPFAVSDITEQTLEHVLGGMPQMRSDCAKMCPEDSEQRKRLSRHWPPFTIIPGSDGSTSGSPALAIPEPASAEAVAIAATAAKRLITVNPFHRPGQRQVGYTRLPNLNNGFCLIFHQSSKHLPSEEQKANLGQAQDKAPIEGYVGIQAEDDNLNIVTTDKEDWVEVEVTSDRVEQTPPALEVATRANPPSEYVMVLSGVALCLAWFLASRW